MTHTDPPAPGAPVGPAHGKRAPAPRTPWYASVPGLKIFMTPVSAATPVVTSDDDTAASGTPGPVSRGVDAPPFSRPGSVLRSSSGAAERGWYAPKLAGAPSTTRQAEILNTGIIGAPTGIDGVVNGTDNLSSTMISPARALRAAAALPAACGPCDRHGRTSAPRPPPTPRGRRAARTARRRF